MPAVFIHGVAVREERYGPLLEEVRKGLQERRPGMQVDGVYWGNYGSSLRYGGASIPGFDIGARDVLGTADQAELASLLLEDSLFELKLMAHDAALGEGAASALAAVPEHVERRNEKLDAARAPIAAALIDARPEYLAEPARLTESDIKKVVDDTLNATALTDHELSDADLIDPVTRALTAGLAVATGDVALDTTFDWPAAERRVETVLEAQFGAARGRVLQAMGRALGRAAAPPLTFALRKGLRRRLMAAQSLFIGDVVRYMSHRETILGHVRDAVEKACAEHGDEELWLVGHSLGGVIAFEYALKGHRDVARLATVGSQVGLLEELGALESSDTTRADRLPRPERVSEWINVYDPDDMLSFLAEPVYHDVVDVPVDTKAPFPLSHSAYWSCDAAYAAIAKE